MKVEVEGWVILHPSGHVELDYFHHQAFNDKGQVVSREEWRRKYRPDCRMKKARVTWLEG